MIITDEKVLRQKSVDVKEEEIGELIAMLERELKLSATLGKPGVGLAAIQCGVAKNIAIVRTPDWNIDLINARIEKQYNPVLFREEGCLSIPNRTENTMRYNEIVVRNSVDPKLFILTGFPAIVVQHELDHTNGLLMQDRALAKPKTKLRPNDICNCGSNRKYKRCCGAQ